MDGNNVRVGGNELLFRTFGNGKALNKIGGTTGQAITSIDSYTMLISPVISIGTQPEPYVNIDWSLWFTI
jgi:hypothetical protein